MDGRIGRADRDWLAKLGGNCTRNLLLKLGGRHDRDLFGRNRLVEDQPDRAGPNREAIPRLDLKRPVDGNRHHRQAAPLGDFHRAAAKNPQ
jgi:hypothetical protein